MSVGALPWRLIILVCLSFAGCSPTVESRLDEQKNPFFQEGKRRAAALDYKGAIEAFERALETNPRSALAHYELGVLYDQRESDYPAAIYHYTKAIHLRPDGSYPADLAGTRIPVCKQEMVKIESMATINPSGLRELERLRDENTQIRRQMEALQAELARRETELAALRQQAGSQSARLTGSSPTGGGNGPAHGSGEDAPVVANALRTYVVKSGETPIAIARRYGVKLSAFLAANPGLEPRRMRAGQTVNIPPP